MSFLLNNYFELEKKSLQLRLDLLDMLRHSGGHIGGSLSSLDLLIALYSNQAINLPAPDHFVLSPGHICPALYVVLADRGLFPKKQLTAYARFKSRLQGHVSTDVPGVDYSSGSLGQGLSFAAGLALADKKHTTVCFTSDGEHQEGQTWEAVMLASKYRLGNLVNIIDRNNCQIDGSTEDVMPLDDLAAKYIRFGWTVTTFDGHNFGQIFKALKNTKGSTFPNCLIANTVFGKGISFMQYDYHYHDIKNLDDFHYQLAKNELQQQLQKYE